MSIEMRIFVAPPSDMRKALGFPGCLYFVQKASPIVLARHSLENL